MSLARKPIASVGQVRLVEDESPPVSKEVPVVPAAFGL